MQRIPMKESVLMSKGREGRGKGIPYAVMASCTILSVMISTGAAFFTHSFVTFTL